MRAQGIDTAGTLDSITDGVVVLSAHGVAPEIVNRAAARGLGIVDVTCPFVTRVHRTARQLYQQGYQLLMVGDPGHTEVKGVVGAVEAIGGTVTLVSTPEQVRDLRLGKKVGLVCQTTQRGDNWAAIVGEVSRVASDVRAINTICNATDELQDAAIQLARQVHVVIVVGGRQSANTRRLRQLCEDQGIPAHHIQTAEEVEENWLEGKEVVGLTAGASTPDWLIEDVACRLNNGKLPEDWCLHHPDE
jgi:4-hydroxy-3-methylbut-2-enyl diphosphate reductase